MAASCNEPLVLLWTMVEGLVVYYPLPCIAWALIRETYDTDMCACRVQCEYCLIRQMCKRCVRAYINYHNLVILPKGLCVCQLQDVAPPIHALVMHYTFFLCFSCLITYSMLSCQCLPIFSKSITEMQLGLMQKQYIYWLRSVNAGAFRHHHDQVNFFETIIR